MLTTTKEGAETPTMEMNVARKSTHVLCFRAAMMPRGTPASTDRTMASSPSWMETGQKSPIMSLTVLPMPLVNDGPKSPWRTMPHK